MPGGESKVKEKIEVKKNHDTEIGEGNHNP